MTTMTAQILVGHSHPEEGGINPTHWLYLSQKSRPTWTLSEENLLDISEETPVEWITSTEYLLEDALLMIAVCILNDTTIKEMLTDKFTEINLKEKMDLSCLTKESRERLYVLCKEKTYHYQLIISIFSGSGLTGCERILEQYGIQAEICYSNKIITKQSM